MEGAKDAAAPAAASSSKSFSCVLCSKTFSEHSELQSHFRTHASDKSLKPSRRLFQTQKSMSDADPVKCDVCGASFVNNTAAIQHKFRKHPNTPNNNHCKICGMAFPLKAFLDRHMQSHTGNNRPKVDSPCFICGEVFDNNPALLYHSNTNHQRVMKLFQPIVTAPPSNKIRLNNAGEPQSVYFCHLCGTEYVVKFNLQKHLEDFHTVQERETTPTEMIRCTACDAFFYNRRAYEIHNLGHKPDDLYVTDEKQRLAVVRRVDQDFDMRRVQPVADKYVPTFKRGKRPAPVRIKLESQEDEGSLSPPSSPDSSDSDSDDLPLKRLLPNSSVKPESSQQ